MKAFIGLAILWTVGSGVVSLGTLMGSGKYTSLGMTLCPLSIVGLFLFLALSARQSRKDKEAREDRRWEAMNRQ